MPSDVFTRANISQSVAAGATGLFPLSEAFVASDGLIAITYSKVTSLTVGLVELDY